MWHILTGHTLGMSVSFLVWMWFEVRPHEIYSNAATFEIRCTQTDKPNDYYNPLTHAW